MTDPSRETTGQQCAWGMLRSSESPERLESFRAAFLPVLRWRQMSSAALLALLLSFVSGASLAQSDADASFETPVDVFAEVCLGTVVYRKRLEHFRLWPITRKAVGKCRDLGWSVSELCDDVLEFESFHIALAPSPRDAVIARSRDAQECMVTGIWEPEAGFAFEFADAWNAMIKKETDVRGKAAEIRAPGRGNFTATTVRAEAIVAAPHGEFGFDFSYDEEPGRYTVFRLNLFPLNGAGGADDLQQEVDL